MGCIAAIVKELIMLQAQSVLPSPAAEAAQALLLRNPLAVVRDRRLRHYSQWVRPRMPSRRSIACICSAT